MDSFRVFEDAETRGSKAKAVQVEYQFDDVLDYLYSCIMHINSEMALSFSEV